MDPKQLVLQQWSHGNYKAFDKYTKALRDALEIGNQEQIDSVSMLLLIDKYVVTSDRPRTDKQPWETGLTQKFVNWTKQTVDQKIHNFKLGKKYRVDDFFNALCNPTHVMYNEFAALVLIATHLFDWHIDSHKPGGALDFVKSMENLVEQYSILYSVRDEIGRIQRVQFLPPVILSASNPSLVDVVNCFWQWNNLDLFSSCPLRASIFTHIVQLLEIEVNQRMAEVLITLVVCRCASKLNHHPSSDKVTEIRRVVHDLVRYRYENSDPETPYVSQREVVLGRIISYFGEVLYPYTEHDEQKPQINDAVFNSIVLPFAQGYNKLMPHIAIESRNNPKGTGWGAGLHVIEKIESSNRDTLASLEKGKETIDNMDDFIQELKCVYVRIFLHLVNWVKLCAGENLDPDLITFGVTEQTFKKIQKIVSDVHADMRSFAKKMFSGIVIENFPFAMFLRDRASRMTRPLEIQLR
jgi:hypothetical protein